MHPKTGGEYWNRTNQFDFCGTNSNTELCSTVEHIPHNFGATDRTRTGTLTRQILSLLWLPITPQSHYTGVPNRIRTGVNNVKGCRPRPLDDRDNICKHTNGP